MNAPEPKLSGAYTTIIIGSGIAGLYTALLVAELGPTLLLTKGELEESNTRYAQGGVAAAMAADDSPIDHYHDTITAGAGLTDPLAAYILTTEAPDHIRRLLSLGVPFDRDGAALALTREGGHSARRVLHVGGDATGAGIERTLARRVRESGVDIRERHFVTDLTQDSTGAVTGVVALDGQGTPRRFAGRFLVLACGGAGQLYRHNTNPSVATGDGIALAYRAGATVRDLEFYQFHPTVLNIPNAPRFLISEAARGEGGILRNARGEAYMPRYHPMADLAPRDVVANATVAEMRETGAPYVWLDLTHLPAELIERRFPTILRFCLAHGLDMRREMVPVSPAAHYLMGGVKTDLWGATDVPGLYACGEVSSTGVHGANRLASNSLLEALVFGGRIAQHLAVALDRHTIIPLPPPADLPAAQQPPIGAPIVAGLPEHPAPAAPATIPTLLDLQDLLWRHAGLTREAAGLRQARAVLAAWQPDLPPGRNPSAAELANLTLLGRLLVEGALLREETRGAHTRADFPEPRERFRRHIEFRRDREGDPAREALAGQQETPRAR